MTTTTITPKEYSMSVEERDLLQNLKNLKSQQEYMASLIDRDIYIYVNGTIKKRLGIGDNLKIEYNVELGKIIVTPEEVKEDK